MQMIKPVANAELSNSDNRALEHPSWRLNLSGFQQLRGAGDQRQLAQQGKGGGADIVWGWKGKCITFRLVLFSDIVCCLEKHWKMYRFLGRGQCVCLLLVFCLLAFLQAGLFLQLVSSFHSLWMLDPVFHVNTLQSLRGFLRLVGKKKDQVSPPYSPFLTPVHSIDKEFAPFSCWAQCQVLGVDGHGVFLHVPYS